MKALIVRFLTAVILAGGSSAVAETPQGDFQYGTVKLDFNPDGGGSLCSLEGRRFAQFPTQLRGDGRTRLQMTLPQFSAFGYDGVAFAEGVFGGLVTVTLSGPRSTEGQLRFLPGGFGLVSGKLQTLPGTFELSRYRNRMLDGRLAVSFRFEVDIAADRSCDVAVQTVFDTAL